RHATAGQTGELERDPLVDPDELRLAHDGELRERPGTHHRRERRPAEREPRRPVGHPAVHVVDAGLAPAAAHVADATLRALAAGPVERDHDGIAGLPARDPRTDLGDATRALVTEHHRRSDEGGPTVPGMEIRAADARCGEPDDDLA